MSDKSLIVVADTSVLLNFIKVNRLDLIARSSCDFIITDHVRSEITQHYPQQQKILENALEKEILKECELREENAINLFATLIKSNRIGKGECSAIAYAVAFNYKVALDDKRATKEAIQRFPHIEVVTTQNLILSMIKENLLDINEADDLKVRWENEFRFRLPIKSFKDLTGGWL